MGIACAHAVQHVHLMYYIAVPHSGEASSLRTTAGWAQCFGRCNFRNGVAERIKPFRAFSCDADIKYVVNLSYYIMTDSQSQC